MAAENGGRIEPGELFGLAHYDYGEAFFGSHRGMRFRLAREPLRDVRYEPAQTRHEGAVLLATVWAEPLSYAATPEAERVSASFPVTEEGYAAAVEWLNERSRDYSGGAGADRR